MKDLDFWLAYAAFHAGDYQRASDVRLQSFSPLQPECSLLQEYENILKHDPRNSQVYINLACCYFMLGKYVEAEETAVKGLSSSRSLSPSTIVFPSGPKSPLQTRVLFHVAHKQSNEEKLMSLHRQLQDVIEDQMCLASMHYMRSHFQEALDIYKRYLVENR